MVPKLRKFVHEDRLRIARLISDRVVKKYRKDVLAIYVCGSTSKTLDRPYSDLEMIVVIRDTAKIPMKYYLHRGLIIQIEYLQSSKILTDAEQFMENWPWEADEYRNRIRLYERDGWFRRLDVAVSKSDRKDSVQAIRKAFMMMTESMAVLRNAVLTNDKVGVLSRGRVLADDAARILLVLNRKYIATTSWFWRISFDLHEKPRDFRRHVEKMSGFVPTTVKEVIDSSERMYKEISDMVSDHGAKIERDNLWV